jgi:hypothetical protein
LADSVGGTLPGDAAATEAVRAPEVLPVLAGRIRAGETATPFSGLDEGLLEGFLAAPPQTDLFADREPLLSSDLAASLLTGAAPRPDLLPQEGSQVAPAATLLPAGAEQPGGSDGAAQGAPLSELFIDPTVIGPAPGALTAPAGEAAGGAALPAAGLHHLLLAGATVAGLAVRAVRQRIRRRRKAEGEEDRPTLPPRA